MGFCTDEQYEWFLREVPTFERMLVNDGIILLKYWFSVSDEEQQRRFQSRLRTPPSNGSSARWIWNPSGGTWTTREPRT